MKKILFLLLSTIAMYGQVPADATPLENIQITNNTTDNSATKVNVQSTDGTINTISKSDLVNVVEVNDVPSLPITGVAGKIYVVGNVNKIYRWNGTFCQELAVTDISGKINLSEKGAINGVATLGSGGKIPNSQIPALAISETFPVSSQAQMLALSQADQGDVAIRSDISKSFILRVSPSSVLANWSELLTPTSAVTSVAGKVGVVTLNTSDIGGLQTDLNLKANDSDVVKLSGNQTISGQKSFSLTGKIDMQTNNGFPAITATALGSINGQSAAEFINNSSSTYSTALRLRTSSSGGVGNMALNVSNQSPIGTGILSHASNGGVSISSQSGDGDSYVSNITYGGTGRNYVGRNNGTETYSVDKIGNVIGNSYIKRSTPANNILLAGGGDIAQNTAFNKNFGTTAGTVVEGGTLGSNAYNSTNIFPINEAFDGNVNSIENIATKLFASSNALDNYGSFLSFGQSGYTTQINSVSALNGDTFIRVNGGGSYGSWRKLWHDGNFNPANYLPLTGGIINGSLTVQNSNYTTFSLKGTNTGNNGGGLIRFENQNTLFGEIAVETESAGNGVIYLRSLTNGAITQKASIASSGAVTFSSTVTASPATLPNHVVVKSQLDAYLPLSGGTLTGIVTAPTAAPGTNTTQIATTAFVQANSRPYKVYTALLSQSGTSAPVATVLENTLDGSITWSRNSVGLYLGTLENGFSSTLSKVRIFISGGEPSQNTTGFYNALPNNIDSVQVNTRNTSGSLADSLMSTGATIEIRVYN